LRPVTGPRALYLAVREAARRRLVRQFNRTYYHSPGAIANRRWLGRETIKYPTDLWVYQEILASLQPRAVIETGTWHGGSALFLATVLDALGEGRVISIDSDPRDDLPSHPRITYLTGSSTDPEVVARARDLVGDARPVLVILDSDHSRDHVLAELRAYAGMVDVGGYVIVEDTIVNGNPVYPDFGPGPAEAVEAFLAENDGFEADRSREEMLVTANPGGYLRRVR
jgi:cephalosporin hydroxylase